MKWIKLFTKTKRKCPFSLVYNYTSSLLSFPAFPNFSNFPNFPNFPNDNQFYYGFGWVKPSQTKNV